MVLVERKTRYPFLKYIEDRTTKNVNASIKEMLENIPIESLTVDNDISFQKHKELSKIIKTECFVITVTHTKGTVENRNS